MKATFRILLFSFLSFISANEILGTTYTAIDDLNWTDPLAWSPNGVPGALDEVIIDGFNITIDDTDGDITINKITVTNSSGTGNSYLFMYGSTTLTVNLDIIITSENQLGTVRFQVGGNTIVKVSGDILLTRTADNLVGGGLEYSIKDSGRVNVTGDVTYDYKNAKSSETSREINLEDDAVFDITGNLYCYIRAGKEFELHIRNQAQLLVGGDMLFHHLGGEDLLLDMNTDALLDIVGNFDILNSGGINSTYLDIFNQSTVTVGVDMQLRAGTVDDIILVEVHGAFASSSLRVYGDVTMDALSEGDVTLQLDDNSNLYLGGKITRTNNYGILTMGADATITYNSSSMQVLAASELSGNGSDAFNYSNLVLDNSLGFTLEDTLIVENNLNLISGKITTTSAKILIISDQATITGGSETAYINGPLIKAGRSGGAPFIFPIGDSSDYAPLEVSKITSATSQYVAQFFGDPPPFGTALAPDITDINDFEYWNLDKVAGSEDVDVTLHWTDADAEGIFDLESLIVVGLSASNVWENYGNGGTTGGTGSGVSGSVSSTDGDPPPFGVVKFTFGTLPPPEIKIKLPGNLNGFNGANELLPVELIDFRASEDKHQNVVLSWETASEQDNMQFVIERSADGRTFEALESVNGMGTTTLRQFYSYVDTKPIPLAYYRLKQVDYDGSYVYLNVIYWKMNRTQKDRMAASPTLAENEINLRFTTYSTKKSVLTIVNSFGKVMHSEEVYSTDLLEYRKLDLNNYVNGIYIIILSDGFNNVISRFVVSKTY